MLLQMAQRGALSERVGLHQHAAQAATGNEAISLVHRQEKLLCSGSEPHFRVYEMFHNRCHLARGLCGLLDHGHDKSLHTCVVLQVSEDRLISILEHVNTQATRSKPRVTIQRRSRAWEDDD